MTLMRRLAPLTLAVTLLAARGTQVVNPVTGRTERTVMDDAAEVAQGRAAHQQILKEYGVVDRASGSAVSRPAIAKAVTMGQAIDGVLVEWGERLFYPGNRIVRPRPTPRMDTRLRRQTAVVGARIQNTVSRRSLQVMVNVTGGGRGMAAIAAHSG